MCSNNSTPKEPSLSSSSCESCSDCTCKDSIPGTPAVGGDLLPAESTLEEIEAALKKIDDEIAAIKNK